MSGPSTRAVHDGETPDRSGALGTAIVRASTFLHPEFEGQKNPFIYSRYTNPTLEAVEKKLGSLDGGGSLLFASGMGAIQATCTSFLKAGDTIAVQRGVYGGTMAYLREELSRFGVKVKVLGATKGRIPRGTKLVWMESITNPLLRVADVGAWADAAHDAGALLCVDATFATPIQQRPLKMGADIVVHSGTKYLGGHSDLIAGVVTTRKELRDEIWLRRRNLGAVLDPTAAWLLGRGVKTLAVRLQRQVENAHRIAQLLMMNGVKVVHYPGLPDHPDHGTAKRVLSGYGGMVTFDLGSKSAAIRFRRNVKLIRAASSLGGVESLVSLPFESSHRYASPASRKADGITDGLVRLSCGIEDGADLERDVRQAL